MNRRSRPTATLTAAALRFAFAITAPALSIFPSAALRAGTPAAPAAPAASGAAALFDAIEAGNAEAVQALLAREPALASARRDDRGSAVQAALFRRVKNGFVPPPENGVLKAVLAARPSLDFFDACGVGDAPAVRAALDRDKTLVSAWTSYGWTPLHLAAFSGSEETAKLLIQRGADVHARARSRFRNTPLQAALLAEQGTTAKLLLENGADALVRQAKGFTPLHEAAFRGRPDLVELLLAHGAEVGSRADDGRTPLAEALRGGHAAVADLLRSKGAVADDVPAAAAPKR